jgi:polyhydroxyalkanoate synthesis regulator phasin
MHMLYREVVMPRSELRTARCYPSAEEINALPEKFRQYIHDLVSRCDKSGDVQTIALLREDRDALQRRVEELEKELQRVRTGRL